MERLESFVSRLIEGWSARLFGAKLQPVQIAKRLIRTMEAHQTISLSKTFVPNSYVVSLSATDFAQFEQYRRSLERDIEMLESLTADEQIDKFFSVRVRRDSISRRIFRYACVNKRVVRNHPGVHIFEKPLDGGYPGRDRSQARHDRPRSVLEHTLERDDPVTCRAEA